MTNLMGGVMFGAASFAIDMVGSVGYLIQMAGTWTNNRAVTDVGLGVQTGAAVLGDGLTQVTAATFDMSSGAFQTGRTYVDTMLVVDMGIGLVKAAVPILKLAAAGAKALRVGVQAVTRIAFTGTKAFVRSGGRAAATLVEDGWTAFKRLFGNAETASSSAAAAKGFATGAHQAVFWSGVGRGGDKVAAEWAAKNGGATLETTMASRGITLPAWDSANPAVVSAWRDASAQFARGASGNVRVLQGDAVRLDSVWAQVEFPALTANPNVTSITSINPSTGATSLLWRR